ncbi:lymphocyte antigen 75-like [Triplophysa dalaica]|uniref:lymphocyte antigen 75-like n=1 Tax=Triplophysa dalaica TaxID=1582913 RepID=UPI0024E018F5|nr:lymphocyte antigen 75-like [Triplophysa dalaica]
MVSPQAYKAKLMLIEIGEDPLTGRNTTPIRVSHVSAVLSFSECSLRQYHFVNRVMSWGEAQRYCRENHTDLTTVNNMIDLKNIMNTVNNQTVWIGLHKMNNITWRWSLGDPAFYIDEHKTWHQAQSYCRENHTDLASVRNITENEKIRNLTKNHKAWIGLFRDSWVWSDNSSSSFRNWNIDEPNFPGVENCTSLTTKGTWINSKCEDKFPFVCHNDKLVLFRENGTGALEHCRSIQMDLVCVESEEIQRGVMNVMKDTSTSEVWLGLRHSCVVGIWFWVSGEIMCYQKWAEGNGTGEEDCSDGGRAAAIQTGPDHTWISLPGSR